MAIYKDKNIEKALSALYNQQKQYISACCHSNNCVDTAENAVSSIMLRTIENMVVEDIMNGGEHDIKNYNSVPQHPVLVIDSTIFCDYHAAKSADILSTIGCPLEGHYNIIQTADAMTQMIGALQSLPLAEFVNRYYIEGDLLNGSARLISMLEKLYNDKDFTENSFSITEVDGSIIFDNRAKVAAMQFINANTNGKARYESSALYYGDTEIKAVGAELGFSRGNNTEDFMLSKLTLQLFIDDNCSEFYTFRIMLGANEQESARSLGSLFTAATYPRFADNAASGRKSVLHLSSEMFRDKACGGADDNRTLKQLFDDYEVIARKTSTPAFVAALMDRKLSEADLELARDLNDYCDFFEEWRNALDFVQYSTLTVAMPNSPTDNYKVISLFKNKEDYIRYFTMLTGGFSNRIRPLLLDKAEYPEKITEYISFHDLQVLSGATIMRFRDEVNAMVGNRRDLTDVITVPELKALIDSIVTIRNEHFKTDNIPEASFNALFAAEKSGNANILLQYCDEYYFETINEPINDMHRFALAIGNDLYSNATMTVGRNDILLPAGVTDYWFDERNETHEIYIDMPTKAIYNKITLKFKDGKLIGCNNDIYVTRDEQYSNIIATQEDIERCIPYPEIRATVAKYLFP